MERWTVRMKRSFCIRLSLSEGQKGDMIVYNGRCSDSDDIGPTM